MSDTPKNPEQSAATDQSSQNIGDLPEQALSDREAEAIKGGATPQKADGSLDAGIHFKYDIKAQKEG